MLKVSLENYILHENDSYDKFIRRLDCTKYKALFVISSDKKFLGTVTEGDSRRYIIKARQNPKIVKDFYNKNSVCFNLDQRNFDDILKFDTSKGEIPVLNKNNEIVDVYSDSAVFPKLSKRVKNSITTIAPTRISFAGGGSDLANWFKNRTGFTINLAIQKYAMVVIEPRTDKKIYISSFNTGEELLLELDELEKYQGKILKLVVNAIKKFSLDFGFNLSINCDFDPGTGLGGSSSLTVALVKALSELSNFEMTKDEIYKLAYEIERVDTNILGGWQDFIPAAFGGLCYTKYTRSGISVQKLALDQPKLDLLSTALFIVRVGEQRQSSEVHEQLLKNNKEIEYTEKMSRIIGLVDKCLDIFGLSKWDQLGNLMHEGWLHKKAMGSQISNQTIDNMYDLLLNSGADGGRLLGAGGSGFLLMFVPMSAHLRFFSACKASNIQVERIRIDTGGTRVIGNI